MEIKNLGKKKPKKSSRTREKKADTSIDAGTSKANKDARSINNEGLQTTADEKGTTTPLRDSRKGDSPSSILKVADAEKTGKEGERSPSGGAGVRFNLDEEGKEKQLVEKIADGPSFEGKPPLSPIAVTREEATKSAMSYQTAPPKEDPFELEKKRLEVEISNLQLRAVSYCVSSLTRFTGISRDSSRGTA